LIQFSTANSHIKATNALLEKYPKVALEKDQETHALTFSDNITIHDLAYS